MRFRLKGLNTVTKRLADGSKATYHYAWKSGPRLTGQPGSPEFFASYNEAVAKRAEIPIEKLQFILERYQESQNFLDLADRTRKDYVRLISVRTH